MARIPEKNPRFRTKSQIVGDLALVLNAPLSWGTQYAVVEEALWVWSEFDGKYDGCERWSEAAWAGRKNRRELRHDHGVPKKLLREELRALRGKATTVTVEAILTNCMGTVITKAEDAALTKAGYRAKLPSAETDPLARYRAIGIALRAKSASDAV